MSIFSIVYDIIIIFIGLKFDQLSRDVIEIFPKISISNLLTATTDVLEKRFIETVIEVSDCCQENYHLKSVLHVDSEQVDSEESFNLIADLIEQKKQSDNNVAIVCEKGKKLAATLALTHPIKYDGYKTKNAAELVLRKVPNLNLDEKIMEKLKKWEWKAELQRRFFEDFWGRAADTGSMILLLLLG